MSCCPPEGIPGKAEIDGWSSTVLWNSDVVSARLLVKSSASLTDKKWLILEMENHTQKTLQVGQTWMHLNMTLREIPSGNVLTTSGLSGVFRSIKTLSPGRHRFCGDTLESADIGLPPVTGLRVEIQAKVETEIVGGDRYQTPKDAPSVTFDWRYPSATEMTELIQEMKQHLKATGDLEKNLFRMSALFKVPKVQDSLVLEDYLPALRASRDNVRHLLVPNVFVKYADAPEVLAYYREAFQTEPDVVYWDAADYNIWNEEFLEPIVQGCEKGKWHYFSVLRRHTSEWRKRAPYVARVSAALLKHHPILKRQVQTIPDKELSHWATAVLDAGAVADPKLVELLKPALEDKRQARINYGSGGWHEGRVCDRALSAILQILDGDSWAAFLAAGVTGWGTEEKRLEAYGQVIKTLTKRLKSLPKEERLESYDQVIEILTERLKSLPVKK
tara:strand:- start:44379 stop:45713 length:1335 start_codon:yes stop_codon:yes gene_type:complete